MTKRSRLGPLPGGGDKYVSTLQKCLEFVEESKPSQEQLKEWFFKTFPSKRKRESSKRTVNDYVNTIIHLELIVKGNGKYLLSDTAKKILRNRENYVLYQILDANYICIHEIVELLYENPHTLKEICLYLRKNETQCVIRLNWLRSIGYLVKDGPQYSLTREARKTVESKIEEKPLKHREIIDIIIKLGNAYNLHTEKEYAIDGYKVDVVWKKIKTGDPSEAFEVQLRGNLHEALSKLKHAWDKWNSRPYLVTTPKYKLKANGLVSGSFHEMQNAMQILTWKEVVEWHNVIQGASRVTKDKMKGRGITAVRQTARPQVSNEKKRKESEEKV